MIYIIFIHIKLLSEPMCLSGWGWSHLVRDHASLREKCFIIRKSWSVRTVYLFALILTNRTLNLTSQSRELTRVGIDLYECLRSFLPVCRCHVACERFHRLKSFHWSQFFFFNYSHKAWERKLIISRFPIPARTRGLPEVISFIYTVFSHPNQISQIKIVIKLVDPYCPFCCGQ